MVFRPSEKHVSQNCARRNLGPFGKKYPVITFGHRIQELQLEDGRVKLSQKSRGWWGKEYLTHQV